MRSGARVGGLYRSESPATDGPGIRACVNVADLEATLAAAEAAGVFRAHAPDRGRR